MAFERLVPLIKKYDEGGKVIEPVVDPEDKQYLILMVDKDDEENKTWEVITGRSAVYDYIKESIECIDVVKSHILLNAPKMSLAQAITVYAFMKHMEDFFEDESFSIEDYLIEGQHDEANSSLEKAANEQLDKDDEEENSMMDQVRDVRVGTSEREDV